MSHDASPTVRLLTAAATAHSVLPAPYGQAIGDVLSQHYAERPDPHSSDDIDPGLLALADAVLTGERITGPSVLTDPLDVPCDWCHAAPGQPCHRDNGAGPVRSTAHMLRGATRQTRTVNGATQTRWVTPWRTDG